jgi:Transposase domain (DUF772)
MGRQDRVSGNSYTSLASTRRSRETTCCGGFNVFTTAVLADLHEQLKAFYSEIGRPSVDTELMIRMLLVGYCYGIHHERRLRQEVELHLAYRWFCKLDLNDRFRPFDLLGEPAGPLPGERDPAPYFRTSVVAACMDAGLVKGEGSRWMRTS